MIEIREYEGKFVVMNLSSNQSMAGLVLMPKGLEKGKTPSHFTIADAVTYNDSYLGYPLESYKNFMKKALNRKKKPSEMMDYDIAVEHVVAIRDITDDLIKSGVELAKEKKTFREFGFVMDTY